MGDVTSHARLLRWVLLAVAAGAAAVAVGVALLLAGIVHLRASADATLRSDTYLVRVIDVERSVVDAETGLRGYVLTGDAAFLGPLLRAQVSLPPEAAALEDEANRENAYVSQAHQLFESARDYMSGYVVSQLALMARDPGAARTLAATLAGKRVVDAIRQRAAALERLVSARQATRERAAQQAANRAVADGIAVLVLLTLLTVLLGGILGRLLVGRERARERSSFMAEASKQLDRAVTIDQTLDTFAALVDGRLSECCLARALAGDAFEPETPPARASCGDAALLALAEADAIGALAGRARAAAATQAATTTETLTVEHDGRPVQVLAVAGVARGRLITETILLRHGAAWRPEQVEDATELASRLALAVHARALQAKTEADYVRSDRTAVTLQQSFVPRVLPEISRCELAVRFTPAGEGDLVGGDFYDVFEVGPDRWAIVVGDVCGKGAEAAAVTAMARWTLRSLGGAPVAPPDALEFLNAAMLRQDFDGRFITIAYLLVTVRAGAAHVIAACGGHPAPILVPAAGEPSPLDVRGDLIGMWPDARLDSVELDLGPGDSLVVYTDGVTDLGPEPPQPPQRALRGRAPNANAATLARTLEQHALRSSDRPRDDIAVLALRFVGEHPPGEAPPSAESEPLASAEAAAAPDGSDRGGEQLVP